LLGEISGFDRTTAWSVIAEIGIDMSQLPSADHLALLGEESARETMKAQVSDSVARRARIRQKLCQGAWCASRCKNSYFAAFFQRIAAPRGRERAIVAVSQLNHKKLTRYFVKRLTRLGHRVTMEPCSAPA
jgi:transposase